MDVSNSRVLPYAVTLGFLGAGALVGLVVATGNLVLIALVIGAVAGLVLLNALPLAVWLILAGVLVVSGPVAYFVPALTKISWLFSLLGVFMSGAALLYAAVGRERPARPVPVFVIFALLLMVFAGVTAFFSNGSLSEISSGAKRQFQFWGVVFLFAVVPFSQVSVRRWMLFLLGVALIQFPFALYQRMVLVPQVMGFERPGFVPFEKDVDLPDHDLIKEWVGKQNKTIRELTVEGWAAAMMFVHGLKLAGPEFSQEKLISSLNQETNFTANGLKVPIDWTKQHEDPRKNPEARSDYICNSWVQVRNGKMVPILDQPGKPWVCMVGGQEPDQLTQTPTYENFAPAS